MLIFGVIENFSCFAPLFLHGATWFCVMFLARGVFFAGVMCLKS
jgi:hypothetical protein